MKSLANHTISIERCSALVRPAAPHGRCFQQSFINPLPPDARVTSRYAPAGPIRLGGPRPADRDAMATRNPNLNSFTAKRAMAADVSSEAEAELHGARGEWWWTGRKPWDCPGFDTKAGVLRCGPERLGNGPQRAAGPTHRTAAPAGGPLRSAC